MDLRIRVEGEGTHRVVHLTGECDLASAPQLRETLRPLAPPDVTSLVLDLAELDFLDSTGLGVLLGSLRRLREQDGELKIAGARGQPRQLLAVTGLDRILPLFPDVAAART